MGAATTASAAVTGGHQGGYYAHNRQASRQSGRSFNINRSHERTVVNRFRLSNQSRNTNTARLRNTDNASAAGGGGSDGQQQQQTGTAGGGA
jgi:hypothetical protein